MTKSQIFARKLDPTPVQRNALYLFLSGQLSSREASKLIGSSHQGLINAAGTFARECIQAGDLAFSEGFLKTLPKLEHE